MVARAASDTLRLSLPPDVDLLLNDQQLAQETFVLWDLIHDRTHSHGDLPFDPFMIKQRMPYWMYALEELRCDLATFRETLRLDDADVHLGRFIRHAIVFDRLFRFTITGDRVRNYDGLGGQIIFAWLHRDDVLRWTDNTLTIDWARLTDSDGGPVRRGRGPVPGRHRPLAPGAVGRRARVRERASSSRTRHRSGRRARRPSRWTARPRRWSMPCCPTSSR